MSLPSLFREDYSGQTDKFKVDRENSVVHNVKILGWTSRNKRKYRPEGIQAKTYEGVFVNVDHIPEGYKAPPAGLPVDRALQGRSVRSRFARLTGVTKEADGLYAESLVCNPEHPFTKEFLWWAENAPDAVVLSHMAAGPRKMEKDGSYTVLGIEHVESVDIVSKGGTNATLFESDSNMDPKIAAGEYLLGLFPEADLETIKAKLTKALESPAEFTGDVNAALVALRDSTDPRVRIVVESYDAKLASEAVDAKRNAAKVACKTARLPDAAITAVFIETLVSKPETDWTSQIEDRKAVTAVKASPTSGTIDAPKVKSVDDFVKSFRGKN